MKRELTISAKDIEEAAAIIKEVVRSEEEIRRLWQRLTELETKLAAVERKP